MHLDLVCCQSFVFPLHNALLLFPLPSYVYSLLFVNCIFEMPKRSQSFSRTRASITNSPRCSFVLSSLSFAHNQHNHRFLHSHILA